MENINLKQKKNYTLKSLGNDSGFGQSNTSYYYEDKKNNNLYIFDFGFTNFTTCKLYFNLNSYNDIYIAISHLHEDHVGSLSQIILYAYSKYGIKINIISKCVNIEKYLEITGVSKNMYRLLDDYINGDISINSFKTSHVDTMDCYSFLIEIDEKKIIYSSDTNTIEPYIPYFDTINEIYIDTCFSKSPYHLNINDSYNYLKSLDRKNVKVKLIHLDDKIALDSYISEFEYEN